MRLGDICLHLDWQTPRALAGVQRASSSHGPWPCFICVYSTSIISVLLDQHRSCSPHTLPCPPRPRTHIYLRALHLAAQLIMHSHVWVLIRSCQSSFIRADPRLSLFLNIPLGSFSASCSPALLRKDRRPGRVQRGWGRKVLAHV